MTTPEELETLADRIDPEKLWSKAGLLEWRDWPQEKQDQMWAGIHLRRYAHDRDNMLKQLKEGAMYIRGTRLERASWGTNQRGCGDAEWHRACKAESSRLASETPDGKPRPWAKMMHAARTLSDEVPRMVLLFQRERERGMPDTFKICSRDLPVKLTDNHLYCALGQECRKCPHLAAIDRSAMTPEAKDEAKAWTCATHFLLESRPDIFLEQILYDKSDDEFDAHIARSMGAEYD